MKHILYIFLVISLFESTAQQLVVGDSEKASYVKGGRIKEGSKINLNKKVTIHKPGYLVIEYGRWTFSLESGIYDMDSVIRAQKQRREFIVDDSIYSILETQGLVNCQRAGIQCTNIYEFLNPNYKSHRIIVAHMDTVVLRWDDRAEYKGRYYVVFSTMFDELVHLAVTDKKELDFNLVPFKKEKLITYKVISEDCIESELMSIRIE